MTISFIIPSFNSRKTIERTIESILAQTVQDQIKEIFVVDSSDDAESKTQLLDLKSPLIKILMLNQKTIPAEGRNMGAKQAVGDLLCFIDSDVFLSKDWLAEILKARKEGCMVGCGSVSIPDFQKNNVLALGQLYLQFNESLAVGKRREITLIPACNMFCDRELFNRAGGFPDLRASEDVMFCLKVRQVTPVWFVPEAKCYHIFRESYPAYFRNQIVLGKHIILYRREYYNKWYYKGAWPLILLPAFILIKMGMIKIRILKAGWKHFGKFLYSLPVFLIGLFYWGVGFAEGCKGAKGNE